jgi:hypothetical protein
VSADHITITQASALLKISLATLRRWDKSGRLPSIARTAKHERLYDRGAVLRAREGQYGDVTRPADPPLPTRKDVLKALWAIQTKARGSSLATAVAACKALLEELPPEPSVSLSPVPGALPTWMQETEPSVSLPPPIEPNEGNVFPLNAARKT